MTESCQSAILAAGFRWIFRKTLRRITENQILNFEAIHLLILDVDGVLTDGRIRSEPVSGPTPSEDCGKLRLGGKTFHTHDGSALKLWKEAGHSAAWLSGRSSRCVETRAMELAIDWCRIGVKDKSAVYDELLGLSGIDSSQVAYVGDDLPDLPVMRKCALPIAVANARPAVKRRAAYITRCRGGDGATAEVVELILRKQGRWKLED